MKNLISLKETPRFLSFSKEEKNIVEAGVDLYKHYLYAYKDKKEYAESAKNGSYEEKSKVYTESLQDEAIKRSGLSLSGFSRDRLLLNPSVKWSAFELISETLDIIIPQTVLDDFYKIAEVRTGNFGDNFLFHVPSSQLFTVSKTGNGINFGQPQKLYSADMPLTPVPRSIDIEEDYYRVLCGKVNFGEWVTRVALSFETQLSIDVYNAFNNTFASLPTQLKVAGYNETALMNLAATVEAANNGAKPVLMGTKVALGKILPSNDYLKVELGEMYNTLGYVSNFRGYDAIVIPQKLKPNSLDLAIDDNSIYVVSLGISKAIKIAFEGQTLITETNPQDRADNTIAQHVQKSYEVGVITSSKYGILHIA